MHKIWSQVHITILPYCIVGYIYKLAVAIAIGLTVQPSVEEYAVDLALASTYPKPFCTSVKISPIKLSAMIIASFVALQGADSLGISAALTELVSSFYQKAFNLTNAFSPFIHNNFIFKL